MGIIYNVTLTFFIISHSEGEARKNPADFGKLYKNGRIVTPFKLLNGSQ